MKLKMKQSVYIVGPGNVQTNQEIEIDEVVGKSLVKAGYAELVVDETPVKEKAPKVEEKTEEPVKPKRNRKAAGDK